MKDEEKKKEERGYASLWKIRDGRACQWFANSIASSAAEYILSLIAQAAVLGGVFSARSNLSEICVVMKKVEQVLPPSDLPVQGLHLLWNTFSLEIPVCIDILLRLRRIHLHPRVQRVWGHILKHPTHGP